MEGCIILRAPSLTKIIHRASTCLQADLYALLPYAVNCFVFENDWARQRFEKGTRPAQKIAVGNHNLMGCDELRELILKKKPSTAQLAGAFHVKAAPTDSNEIGC